MSDSGDDHPLTGTGGEGETADTVRGRADESSLKLRLLLQTDRLAVTAGLAAVVFAAFVVAGATLAAPSFRTTVANSSLLDYLFSSMLGALITGVTLVVTINQLVLAQETGPLGDQHQRMSDAMDVRNYTAELLGGTTPADPSAFLGALVGLSRERAETLRESVADTAGDFREEVEMLADDVVENATVVGERLDGAQFGTFDVVSAALSFNYSWKVFHAERIRDEYDLTDDQRAALEELRTALVMFAPAREHVKTLYFQWALVDLSRLIVYTAIPAIVVAGVGVAFLGADSFPGATLGVSNLLWAVAAGFTVTLVPFLLLVAYILRIATVAKRTLAIGPLILRESQR